MKYTYKRILSAVMVCILVFSSLAGSAYAASGEPSGAISFLPAEPSVIEIASERFADLEGEEAVYLGAASADLTEGDKYYSIPVYREGNLDTEASVSLLTLDVSALYGSDYELCSENVYWAGQETTILQRQYGGNTLVSEEERLRQAQQLNELYESYLEEEEEPLSEGDSEGDSEENTDSGSGLDDFSVTSLITDTLSVSVGSDMTEEDLSDSLVSGAFDYSAGMVIHFAKGESEKLVTFHLFDDELEEGEEMFQFMLADAEGTVIRERYNFMALIKDNEELHDAKIAFDSMEYSDELGKVRINVIRTGSEYSMIEFRLLSGDDTAVAGVNFQEFDKTVIMQPYQTKSAFEFEVSGRGRMNIYLIPVTDCVVEDANVCSVEIDVQETPEELEQARAAEELIDGLGSSASAAEDPSWEVIETIDEAAQTHEFSIDIGDANPDNKYYVKYTGNDKTVKKGTIVKRIGTQDEPVGDYYFATPDLFDYNLYDGWDSNDKKTIYHNDANTYHNSNFELYWHNWKTGKEGGTYIKSKKGENDSLMIRSGYYRYMVPDWESKRWQNFRQCMEVKLCASGIWTDEKGNRDKELIKTFRFTGSEAAFPRKTIDTRARVDIPYSWENRKMQLLAWAGDRSSGCAPYTEVRVYGFAMMYKVYEVKVTPYSGLDYKTAGGASITVIPCVLGVQSGVQQEAVWNEYRTFYTCSDDSGHVVFSNSDIYLNGHTGTFGNLKSWKIVYNPNGGELKSKQLVYPKENDNYGEDPLVFAGYLRMRSNEQSTGQPNGTYIDYSRSAIEKRIQEAEQNLAFFTFDSYVCDWLAYVGTTILDDPKKISSSTFGNEAVQLAFEPVFKYKDCEVYVEEPVKGKGEFKDSSLTVTKVTDQPHKYHCGDTLNVEVKSGILGQQIVGYEYSTDKVHYTTVTDSNDLFLEGNWSRVWIRPKFADEPNRIEVRFLGDAEKHLSVEGLIDKEELEDTEFEEMNILDINPDKVDVRERAKPVIGGAYKLNVYVTDKPENANMEYRPYVLKGTQKIYGCTYPVIAGVEAGENVVQIGVETVYSSSIQDYTVTGFVNMLPLEKKRQTAVEADYTPVSGYVVTMPGVQGKAIKEIREDEKDRTKKIIIYDDEKDMIYGASTMTGDNGGFRLENIRGKAGDIVPILVSSNVNDGYIKYVSLVPGGTGNTVSAGTISINYPVTAPEVTSIMYTYQKPENNTKRDLKKSTVNIVNDTIHFYFTVNEKNRSAEKLIVSVLQYDGNVKVLGEATRAKKSSGKDNGRQADVFTLDVANMPLYMNKTDRMFVSVVDAEKVKVPQDPEKSGEVSKAASITYPRMDTGLTFTTETVPVKPIYYKQELEKKEAIELPMIGNGGGNMGATSGLINWTMENLPDNKGYYMTINIGVSGNTYTPMIKDLRSAQYASQAKTVLEEKIKDRVALAEKIGDMQASNAVKKGWKKIQEWRKSLLDKKIKNLDDLLQRDQVVNEVLQDPGSQPKQGTTEILWNADVSSSIVLYWLMGPDGSYHYYSGNVVFGFTGSFEFTKFVMFSTIPGYVNMGIIAQLGYAGYFEPERTAKAMTDGFFNDRDGNIKDLISTKKGLQSGEFTFGITGFLGAGIGKKGVLSPRGTISLTVQGGVPTPKKQKPAKPANPTPEQLAAWQAECAVIDQENQNGILLEFKGGIEIDLLITTFKLTLIGGVKGWGKYKDQTGFTLFTYKLKTEQSLSEEMIDAASGRDTEQIRVNEGEIYDEYYELSEKLAGTADMSTFGTDMIPIDTGLDEEGLYVSPEILLANAADDAAVQTVPLDEEGSFFMVFIGGRDDRNSESVENGNSQALYYAQYDGGSKQWSVKPTLLDEEGTYDVKPTLTVYDADENEKIVTVTWTSAEKEFEKSQSILDKISSLRMKTAAFRVADSGKAEMIRKPVYLSGRKASESIARREDKKEVSSRYYDAEGSSWYYDGKIYSSFTRYDLTSVEKEEDLLNLYGMQPATYFAVCDMTGGEPVLMSLEELDFLSEEGVLYLANAQIIQIPGETEADRDKTFIAVTYTEDVDGKALTEEDYKLRLSLIELFDNGEEPVMYPSMDISWELGGSAAAPGLTQLQDGDDAGKWVDQSRDPDGDGVEGMALTSAAITEANGTYYLTYLKNGYLFEMINIGEYLDSMFAEDYLADMYRSRAKGETDKSAPEDADAGTENWYQVDTDDLNEAWNIWQNPKMEESYQEQEKWIDQERYEELVKLDSGFDFEGKGMQNFEGSPIEAVSTGGFHSMETGFGGDSSHMVNIDNYELVSDGASLYIIFAKQPEGTEEPTKQLFAARMNPGVVDETEIQDAKIGYSDPVQLTNGNYVISKFKAFVETHEGGDDTLVIYSDCYRQVIPEEGGIIFGKNKIVETRYDISTLLRVDTNRSGGMFVSDPNTEEASVVGAFTVKNYGLKPEGAFRTWVEHDGQVVYEAERTDVISRTTFEGTGEVTDEVLSGAETVNNPEYSQLKSGEGEMFYFSYPLDKAVSEDSFTVYLDDDLDGNAEYSYVMNISSEEKLSVNNAAVQFMGEEYQATVTVTNDGCFKSDEKELILKCENEYGENEILSEGRKLAAGKVPELKAGESTTLTIPFSAAASDFTELGTLGLQAVVGDNEASLTFAYSAVEPDRIVIEGEKSWLSLTKGTTRKLQVSAVPSSANLGDVYYSSSDPKTVFIDENGVMTCHKNGAAKITVNLTAWGLTEDILVYVSEQGTDDEASTSVISQLPSYVEQDGSWKQDENGNWTYTTKAGVKAADRWMAIARSTFGGGDDFEWYRFDKNGLMVTGWFRDSDDRMYYLQTVADGNKGRMLTGWQQIGKKWYYFETVSNGYKGELYVNRTTRDGYYAGGDGVWDGKPKK